jgi:hypothetical protein
MLPPSLLSKGDSGLATTNKLVKSYRDEYKDATNCVTSWLMTNSNNRRYTANNPVPMAKHIRNRGIRTPQHILTALATAIRLREKTIEVFQPAQRHGISPKTSASRSRLTTEATSTSGSS